uniref:DUF4834 family protein n=1 Tax=Alistipes sp. TaxID=1872444 RepID=UPI0040565E4A
MFWNEIWNLIKRNIFAIVLVVTLVIAAPWTLVFVLPIVAIVLFVAVFLWRVRRQQQEIYDEARRQADKQQQQKSQRSWWHRANKNEGEVTVVQTEPTEKRVSDDVGEYVDFKEVKNE